MNTNTEILDSHEAKLTVTVEPEKFDTAKKQAARQLSKKHKIPGFRPGKAPFAVVVKHLGEGAVNEHAIGNLIDELYPIAIQEAEIDPYGPGSLDDMPALDPPTFEFRVPLAPVVTLGEYREIRIDFESRPVTDEDIQKVIDNLRESQATVEPVERAAEEGDMVYITLSGTRKGEEDPETKVLLEERRYPVIIEKADADEASEYPFPGFSRKLIGLKAGDSKSIQYTFKDDAELEDLRGVTGIYKVAVEEIKGRKLPEITDEFAKSVGNFENVDALLAEIRNTLTEQYEAEQISEHENKVLDEILSGSEIKYPPQMLEDEIDDFIHDLEHQLSQQGLTIDLYLKSRGVDLPALRDEVRERAENRMKRGLIIMEVANQESIIAPTEEIDRRLQATLREVAMYYSEEDAQTLSTGTNLANLRNRIATDEIIKGTIQRLRNLAMGIQEEEEEEENPKTQETAPDVAPDQPDAAPEPELAQEEESTPRELADTEETEE